MSKRNNITYVKPQEPSFLAKLKAEIGYKEGPTVDTKRQKLEERDQDNQDGYDSSDQERPEREDEKPQIVVLSRGDLTADEVALEQQRIAKEEAERPADLNQPIVFKQRHKPTKTELESDKTDKSKAKQKSDKSEKRKKSKATSSSSSKLSFNEDEEDAEADED